MNEKFELLLERAHQLMTRIESVLPQPLTAPDWGSTIDDGRRLLAIFPHAALVPAIALMSLVLGLNLLADGLREESLKD